MIANGIVMFDSWSSFFILSDIVGALLLQYCTNNVAERGIKFQYVCHYARSVRVAPKIV